MNIDIAPADLYAASHGKPGDAGKHRRGVKIDRRCTHAESSSRNLHATTQTKALAAVRTGWAVSPETFTSYVAPGAT